MLQTIHKECPWCAEEFDPIMASCGTGTTWSLYKCSSCNGLSAEGWFFPETVVKDKAIKIKSIPNPNTLIGHTVRISEPVGSGNDSTDVGHKAIAENEGMKKSVIDIGWGDADIYVDGQKVLHIGQVSDDDTINLFLYGNIERSVMVEEYPENGCTHEILAERKKKR